VKAASAPRAPIAAALIGAASAAATFALVVACGDARSHIFIGRPYDPTRQCLGDTGSIDIVSGPDPGLGCPATCLIGKLDETSTVYVSTQCQPFPMFFDTSGADPRCAGALAASARDDICDDEGGSSNPIEAGADVVASDVAAETSADTGAPPSDASTTQ
jgi:hypothetical protein